MEGIPGFEPGTTDSKSVELPITPYPYMVEREGLEPPTFELSTQCSAS